jgi:hypothetical protein
MVREQIAKLKQIKAEPLGAAKPTTPPSEVKLEHGAQTALVHQNSVPPAHKSKRVVWGVVIGGIAAVGLAIGLGVGLGDRPHDPVATIGTWRLK